MRSHWKIKKKFLKSYVNLKDAVIFKRSDLIVSNSLQGKKVKIYNGRYFVPLLLKPRMLGLPFRSYVPSTVYGRKVQQKWAVKKQLNTIKKKK